MAPVATLDPQKTEAFVGKVLGDTSATMTTLLAVLGDRLGLFKAMAAGGPATAAELAARAGTQERYTREWLGGMCTAGYVEHDKSTGRFTLPPEHWPAMAQEGGRYFFGGLYDMLPALFGVVDDIGHAFKAGGGVHQGQFDERIWDGCERFTRTWFDNFLLQEWLPATPDVRRKLESGATMADVGCGSGLALIRLADAYPRSRFVGYDAFGPTIVTATERARAAGVGDRVRFEERDVSTGLPETYDVISTFDVVHDAVDPVGLLRSIRQGLKDDGVYICLDFNCSHDLDENAGPIGAMLHGFSVSYCMTTSLAHGGAGLGTLGFHERKVREMSAEAGFSSVRVASENPFNKLYEIRV